MGFEKFIVLIILLILVGFILIFIPVGLWITARFSGVRVSMMTLFGMKIRRVRPVRIVNPMIQATKAGLRLSTDKLEAHYLAGGDVTSVVNDCGTESKYQS